jgi:hypothetical protein
VTVGRGVRRLVLGGLLVGVAVAGALEITIATRLDRIDGAFEALRDRPPSAPGETVLMIGTRPVEAGGADPQGDVPWLAGEQAVESVMLVEIADNRRGVEIVSLPMDQELVGAVDKAPSTWVGRVETDTGRRIDHLMAVDWRMLQELGDQNGTQSTYRFGSSTQAQQAFLETVLRDTLYAELRREPWNLYQALRTASNGTAIDDTWSLLELHSLLFSLRDLRSADITFSTAQSG